MDAKQAYAAGTEVQFQMPEVHLGPWTSYAVVRDPKHMCFALSRYKFCAKLLEGKAQVLEVGCGDGFGIPIMSQAVGKLHCIDWDNRNIEGNQRRLSVLKNVSYQHWDITQGPPGVKVDAAFSIDVLEHVDPALEHKFMEHICQCLPRDGVFIQGTPNKAAEEHSTRPEVHVQHINLKTHAELRGLMQQWFANVFMFGMNDEVVHTGFLPMAHFLWAVGVGVRPSGGR